MLSKFGFAISPLIMTKEELHQKNNSTFLKSIVDAHLQVNGKDLREIVSNVRNTSWKKPLLGFRFWLFPSNEAKSGFVDRDWRKNDI